MENHRQIDMNEARRIGRDLRGVWASLERIVREHKYAMDGVAVIDRFPLDMMPLCNYIEKCHGELSKIVTGMDCQDHNVAIQMARRHLNSLRKCLESVTEAYPELGYELIPLNDHVQTLWINRTRRKHG